MRGAVPDLPSPYPMAGMLPAVLQEDQFVARMMAGFDDVIAPVISVLDCIDSYFDPRLAPEDFVAWLADWLGTSLDDNWHDSQRRANVLNTAELHRMRGTTQALRRLVTLATGGHVEITDPGGASWSQAPTDDSGQDQPAPLLIRVAVRDPASIRLFALDELVTAAKPAHLPHMIEVVQA